MTDKQFLTPIGHLSYPALFVPQEEINPGGDYTDYTCSLLLSEEDFEASGIVRFLEEHAAQKWGAKIPKDLKYPYRYNEHPNTKEQIREVRFKKKTKFGPPRVVDRGKNDITDPDEAYAGCLVRISCTAYTWSHSGRSGVSLGLLAVQKVDDDQRFGGGGLDIFDDLDPKEGLQTPDEEEAPKKRGLFG